MTQKKLLRPERRRQIPAQFSWLDHRLVRDNRLSACEPPALALYLVLVTVADAQGALPGIRAALEARGLKVGRLEQIPPSLEDVFVNLTAARESKPGRTA